MESNRETDSQRPGSPFLHSLYDLGQILTESNWQKDIRVANLLERWVHFSIYSDQGDACKYARKCEDLFMQHDYEQVKKTFLCALEQFRIIEGQNFGR